MSVETNDEHGSSPATVGHNRLTVLHFAESKTKDKDREKERKHKKSRVSF